ncbi:hypothetical protein NQZ68_017694 [Dissostichus eleginoides]|nr:hypothetical protein NQZ68_017694 [Dissostichus eleginoides]
MYAMYPDARAIQRKVIFHAGPTNSGKTYQAIQRYLTAKSGVYCGPLKLLAHEIFEKSNNAGVPCDLVTGEERTFMDMQAKVVVHEWKNVSICFQSGGGFFPSHDVGHGDCNTVVKNSPPKETLSKIVENHLNVSNTAMLAEHKELQEVRTVALQNRIALDLLLAAQGGTRKAALQAPQRLVGYSTDDDTVMIYDAELPDPWVPAVVSEPWAREHTSSQARARPCAFLSIRKPEG